MSAAGEAEARRARRRAIAVRPTGIVHAPLQRKEAAP